MDTKVKVSGNYCQGFNATRNAGKCNMVTIVVNVEQCIFFNNVRNGPVIEMVRLSPFNVEGIGSGAGQVCHQGPDRDVDYGD